MQPHNFFNTHATPGTPTRRHALGRLPTPPPPPENLLLGLHKKLPSVPPASTQEVSESENLPATRGTAHSEVQGDEDRKSTRLNSSHLVISYAVFCLKKKTQTRATLPRTT